MVNRNIPAILRVGERPSKGELILDESFLSLGADGWMRCRLCSADVRSHPSALGEHVEERCIVRHPDGLQLERIEP